MFSETYFSVKVFIIKDNIYYVVYEVRSTMSRFIDF